MEMAPISKIFINILDIGAVNFEHGNDLVRIIYSIFEILFKMLGRYSGSLRGISPIKNIKEIDKMR